MCAQTLTFLTHHDGRTESQRIALRSAVIAGWTGRDPIAREKHIAELEALGVARPKSTPIYYRVAAARLTTSPRIEATGENSSGEVELVLIRDAKLLWLGVGSDHTDRKVETYCVTFSKQMCDKPIAPELWAFDEVRDHWDSLMLRSWIDEGGEQRLYQEGPASAMLPPDAIIAGFASNGSLPEGTAMFCGTLAAEGGIRPSKRFSFELFDPLRARRIMHAYDIAVLPVEG
ncbi:MAG: DUF2848 domain-containing protein [Xanthobacteraceae bacterium]|jgi:hypothetical protein